MRAARSSAIPAPASLIRRRRGVLRISCQDERHRRGPDRDDSQRIERLETDFDAMVIANQAC